MSSRRWRRVDDRSGRRRDRRIRHAPFGHRDPLWLARLSTGTTPRGGRPPGTRRVQSWLAEAGLVDVRVRDFVAMMTVVALVVATLTYALFGAPIPALTAGVFAGGLPI